MYRMQLSLVYRTTKHTMAAHPLGCRRGFPQAVRSSMRTGDSEGGDGLVLPMILGYGLKFYSPFVRWDGVFRGSLRPIECPWRKTDGHELRCRPPADIRHGQERPRYRWFDGSFFQGKHEPGHHDRDENRVHPIGCESKSITHVTST